MYKASRAYALRKPTRASIKTEESFGQAFQNSNDHNGSPSRLPRGPDGRSRGPNRSSDAWSVRPSRECLGVGGEKRLGFGGLRRSRVCARAAIGRPTTTLAALCSRRCSSAAPLRPACLLLPLHMCRHRQNVLIPCYTSRPTSSGVCRVAGARRGARRRTRPEAVLARRGLLALPHVQGVDRPRRLRPQ